MRTHFPGVLHEVLSDASVQAVARVQENVVAVWPASATEAAGGGVNDTPA